MTDETFPMEPQAGPSREQLAAKRAAQFQQANASLMLEGLQVSREDREIQALVARGDITHDAAVAIYLSEAVSRGAK